MLLAWYGEGPLRSFDQGVLDSSALPRIAVRPADGFRYLGITAFELDGIADVDRHHFVDVDEEGHLRRLLILHFEGFSLESGKTYRYGIPSGPGAAGPSFRFSPQKVRLGQHDYIHNTWVFDAAASIEAKPEREMARTAKLLRDNGVELPSEMIMSRFVRVVDEAARHELIIFYLEPLTSTGLRVAQFVEGGRGAETIERLSDEVTARSKAAFEIVAD